MDLIILHPLRYILLPVYHLVAWSAIGNIIINSERMPEAVPETGLK